MTSNLTVPATRMAQAYTALVEALLREGLAEEDARFEARAFVVMLILWDGGENPMGLWSD